MIKALRRFTIIKTACRHYLTFSQFQNKVVVSMRTQHGITCSSVIRPCMNINKAEASQLLPQRVVGEKLCRKLINLSTLRN